MVQTSPRRRFPFIIGLNEVVSKEKLPDPRLITTVLLSALYSCAQSVPSNEWSSAVSDISARIKSKVRNFRSQLKTSRLCSNDIAFVNHCYYPSRPKYKSIFKCFQISFLSLSSYITCTYLSYELPQVTVLITYRIAKSP